MEKTEFKILVAEDDAIVRDVIVRFLSEEGYPVIAANDGIEAVKLLRLENITLVLSDLRMPGADGMEVLRTAMQMNPKTAVVILTAYGTLDTALEAMKEGAYDYIVKPFVMQQLLLVVRNAFTMASLLEENEQLSIQLRETYRSLEALKASGSNRHEVITLNSADRIKKLKQLNMIDEEEARVLEERMESRDRKENIRKYSSLVNDLKNR